jgi:LuxR family transcriptional regulator
MHDPSPRIEWAGFEAALDRAHGLEDRLDAAQDALAGFGFTSIIYDYTPVPFAHDGELITPSLLKLRNIEANMADLWCRGGYYQIDPVQLVAARSATPFVWSYAHPEGSPLARVMGPKHAPVVSYLKDTRMTCGVTVPIHLSDGDFATFTGIRIDPEGGFDASLHPHLAAISLIGQIFHDVVSADFDPALKTCQYVKLTARERECLRLTAQGMTAKQIAHKLGRAVGTINLHLNLAIRKLGAKNRTQAVARAAHYRLLDGAC